MKEKKMILKIQKQSKKIIPLLAIFIALISINLASFGDGHCEEAFYFCWVEHWWEGFDGAIYCGIGYLFCKKYIESTP
jgi:hypothetical protein